MKYKIDTYLDFLNLKLSDINKIIDDDFDLYSDDEMKKLMRFISQFNSEVYNITHNQVSLVVENKKINIFKYTNGELLQYFKEHPNE